MKPAFLPASLVTMLCVMMSVPHIAASEPIVCMPQAELDAALVDWYGEKVLPGQAGDRTKVWVSDTSGTWSMVKYLPDGNGCVIATGDDWEDATSEPEVLAQLEN